MAQAAAVRWDELSQDAQEALEWVGAPRAGASVVGTLDLLIGMLCSGDGAPAALLRHFGTTQDTALEVLRDQLPTTRVDWPTSRRPLTEFPPLTANARRCVERAAELRAEIGAQAIDVPCLLGALLDTEGATARRAIAGLVEDVGIDAVRDATLEWLRGNALTYAETLAQRLPPDGLPGLPYIGVLRTRVRYESGDEEHPITGLGALLPGGELLTAAHLAPAAADAVLVLSETTHEVRTLTSDGRVTVLGLAPAPGVPRGTSRQVVGAQPGQVCNVVAVDDHAPNVMPMTGTVRASDGEASESFVIDLEQPLADRQIATGSPVTDADGAIVDVVD
ncbi:MAG: Clp protease N-terminal domain-containing protein, partial [Solirubrobacteraceae bacterium]